MRGLDQILAGIYKTSCAQQHNPPGTPQDAKVFPRQAGLSRPVVKLTVRRSHLFEDGLISLMAKDIRWI